MFTSGLGVVCTNNAPTCNLATQALIQSGVDQNNCPIMACQNLTGQDLVGAQCEASGFLPPMQLALFAGAVDALMVLPGMWKLLALPLAGYGLVSSLGAHKGLDQNGNCVWEYSSL
jgi:hypothetical protein